MGLYEIVNAIEDKSTDASLARAVLSEALRYVQDEAPNQAYVISMLPHISDLLLVVLTYLNNIGKDLSVIADKTMAILSADKKNGGAA